MAVNSTVHTFFVNTIKVTEWKHKSPVKPEAERVVDGKAQVWLRAFVDLEQQRVAGIYGWRGLESGPGPLLLGWRPIHPFVPDT